MLELAEEVSEETAEEAASLEAAVDDFVEETVEEALEDTTWEEAEEAAEEAADLELTGWPQADNIVKAENATKVSSFFFIFFPPCGLIETFLTTYGSKPIFRRTLSVQITVLHTLLPPNST